MIILMIPMKESVRRREGTFEKFDGYCTDVWFREGMRFITENKNNPFLLYIATNAPHGPGSRGSYGPCLTKEKMKQRQFFWNDR